MTTVTTPEKKLTAQDLVAAVKLRYEPGEWHLETEMTLNNRRLDVVAFNMWGARQYRIVGFEIKVSRGDWLRELDQFQKSENWMEVVDAFYVVTPPKLVRDDELPKGWGLLEWTGNRMMTRAHATHREPLKVLPRELVARLFTRQKEETRRAVSSAEYRIRDEVRESLNELDRLKRSDSLQRVTDERDQLRRERDALYQACGLFKDYNAHAKLIRGATLLADLREKNVNGDDAWVTRQLRQMIQQNEQRIEHLQQALQQIVQEHTV